MIASLKNNIKNHLLRIYSRKRRQGKKNVIDSSGSLEAIGFLYTVDANMPQKTEVIARVVKQLTASGKQVHVLGYLPHQQAKPRQNFSFFHKEDVNLLGKPQQKQLVLFLQTQFKYLYHIDLVSEPILDYMMAAAHASCKIGNFIPGRDYLFDITFKNLVEVGKDIPFDCLIDKMLDYTKMLKV